MADVDRPVAWPPRHPRGGPPPVVRAAPNTLVQLRRLAGYLVRSLDTRPALVMPATCNLWGPLGRPGPRRTGPLAAVGAGPPRSRPMRPAQSSSTTWSSRLTADILEGEVLDPVGSDHRPVRGPPRCRIRRVPSGSADLQRGSRARPLVRAPRLIGRGGGVADEPGPHWRRRACLGVRHEARWTRHEDAEAEGQGDGHGGHVDPCGGAPRPGGPRSMTAHGTAPAISNDGRSRTVSR